MDIEGLRTVIKHDHPYSVLTHFLPVTGGARLLQLETLPTGKAMLELHDSGELPKEGPAERLFIEYASDGGMMLERMVRAMAVFHFGLDEAETNLTGIDSEMLANGFELGFGEEGKPCWIRLSSAMNVVIRNEAEDALPVRRGERISMLCIIPEREQVRYMCENLDTALGILKKNRPFKEAQPGDGSEMITRDVVDSTTVVYH